MTDLSPAAQKVLDAAKDAYWLWDNMCPAEAGDIAVAAIRVAAEQIAVPDDPNATLWEMGFYSGNSSAREALHVIADELENYEK